jgi:nicotinamidase-related amidase
MVGTPDVVALLKAAAPVAQSPYRIAGRPGLIIVDEVNGFCTVGAGALAPVSPNDQVDRMIRETDNLARRFIDAAYPVLVFRDTHEPGRVEPPYPRHCERGTGEEVLVEALRWLESAPGIAFLDKDVIDGVIGGIGMDGSNAVYDWIDKHGLETVILVGICTDICIADACLTLLSSRNHFFGDKPMLPTLKDVVVFEPGCATYHLPAEAVSSLGLPPTAAHDQALFHHIGLAMMQARGAIIASDLV